MKTATLYGLRRLAHGPFVSGGTLASSTADSPAEAAARFASSNVRPRPTILLWSRFHAIHWPACCVVDEAGSRGAADRMENVVRASSRNLMELPPPSWPHIKKASKKGTFYIPRKVECPLFSEFNAQRLRGVSRLCETNRERGSARSQRASVPRSKSRRRSRPSTFAS